MCCVLPLNGFVFLEIIASSNKKRVIFGTEMRLQIRVLIAFLIYQNLALDFQITKIGLLMLISFLDVSLYCKNRNERFVRRLSGNSCKYVLYDRFKFIYVYLNEGDKVHECCSC